ncbi:MAG TPA: phosphotransferase [Ilumatobacter sp.]|nr:phosphotransferase [Ilumatobacter sp.]
MSDLNPTGERRPAIRMETAAGASADLVRECAPDFASAGIERPIEVDQTNHSVVVDERAIVKWYVPPAPAPHRSITLARHLAEVGFAETPRLLGYRTDQGKVLATVTEFLPGARDGWDWLVHLFTDCADGIVTTEEVIEHARAVGALGARLHHALTTPSTFVPEPVTIEAADVEQQRSRELLDRALDTLSTSTDSAARRSLAEHRARIIQIIDAMPSGPTPVAPIHGDLHIGQILQVGEHLIVVDFDGNPLRTGDERDRPRPIAVDVASLIQSIDHAGRVAARRRPDGSHDRLIEAATDAALDVYRCSLASVDIRHLLDDSMLPGLRVAQELHEFVYAAEYLPHWTYAPIGALRGLMRDERGI